jgi:hypothetical protein
LCNTQNTPFEHAPVIQLAARSRPLKVCEFVAHALLTALTLYQELETALAQSESRLSRSVWTIDHQAM